MSSVYDITFNIGHAEVVAKSPSIYSMAEIIILSVILTAMMIIIVVGNMLVIIAIATENNLTTVQNWFIASLAMADMMIGRVVPIVEFSSEIHTRIFQNVQIKILETDNENLRQG